MPTWVTMHGKAWTAAVMSVLDLLDVAFNIKLPGLSTTLSEDVVIFLVGAIGTAVVWFMPERR